MDCCDQLYIYYKQYILEKTQHVKNLLYITNKIFKN